MEMQTFGAGSFFFELEAAGAAAEAEGVAEAEASAFFLDECAVVVVGGGIASTSEAAVCAFAEIAALPGDGERRAAGSLVSRIDKGTHKHHGRVHIRRETTGRQDGQQRCRYAARCRI